jgi:thiol-disulfide isomerase/thioredoxin
VVLGLALVACESDPAPSAAKPAATVAPEADPVFVGEWRATLTSPGGPLPFALELVDGPNGLTATARNGSERVSFSSAVAKGRTLVLRIDGYDSEIRASLEEDTLHGTWTKTTPSGPSTMPFTASRGASARFDTNIEAPSYPVPASVDGEWSIRFTEEDGSTFVGHGIVQSKDGAVHGTILTDTGDYRYLEGRYTEGTLELSCFDGGHAFLFRAIVQDDGSLRGDFWSRAAYHARWTAKPIVDGESPLADPFTAVSLSKAETEGRFRFSFPNASGTTVSERDARFEGKVVLVDIFGTWCPNCNDYAPILARWHRDFGPRGLEVVGLAFEFTGDAKRDRAQLDVYAKTHGIEFPLLLAGTSDKGDAADALPSLDVVKSYPTTVLIGRDGKVHAIHSGFAGPATGEHHTELVKRLESEIETLLGES